MSFTIIDMGSEGFELTANVWTWKPTLEIIRSFNYVNERTLNGMASNGTGVKMSQDDANAIGEKIRDVILPQLVPNKRMFGNLTVTDKPDDGTMYRDADEQWKNYSASCKWLEEFSEFCIKCKGFQVF
jgi:hypothetical protein